MMPGKDSRQLTWMKEKQDSSQNHIRDTEKLVMMRNKMNVPLLQRMHRVRDCRIKPYGEGSTVGFLTDLFKKERTEAFDGAVGLPENTRGIKAFINISIF
ncbi:MAG: hypothetical protein GXO78_01690 [Calditrichaeota bacterium]|nr:hypothetical protein [Calditrichota bacterium]